MTYARTEPVRADVRDDYEISSTLPIQGSPQVFWPDGTTHHNPGLTEQEWIGGIPRIQDADPSLVHELLREKVVSADPIGAGPA